MRWKQWKQESKRGSQGGVVCLFHKVWSGWALHGRDSIFTLKLIKNFLWSKWGNQSDAASALIFSNMGVKNKNPLHCTAVLEGKVLTDFWSFACFTCVKSIFLTYLSWTTDWFDSFFYHFQCQWSPMLQLSYISSIVSMISWLRKVSEMWNLSLYVRLKLS